MERSKDRVGYLFVLAVAIAAFWMAGDFQPDSAVFPRIVSGAMIAISLFLLVTSFVGAKLQDAPRPSLEAGEPPPRGWFIHAGRFAQVLGLTIAYFLGVAYLGYYTATLLMVPVGALMLGLRRRPFMVLSTTVIYVVVIYLVFGVFFERPLPHELILRLV